ncbi:MAG: ABC transporter ATP-binding protein [Candidatus Protochlamydia sp.]|nr:ABC transporter ATP-binding protein [Candidatus Protochlamydia sp.]
MSLEDNVPEIIIDRVSKTFRSKSGETCALNNISLTLQKGDFTCFVGPSGCGKSTLLNLIAGLDFPDSGSVIAEGKPVLGPGSDRLVMFQESALFPWLDVMGNVLFGLKLQPLLTPKERIEIAEYYLRLVKLENFAHRSIHELSGGMKQRAALARSLAPNPRILLMDEPFASLDALTREQLYEDIQQIWQEQKKTIIFVTHNVAEAVCLGDKVFLFSAHPGRIKKEFTVDLDRPREIRSVEVAPLATEITHLLKQQLEQL